MDNARVIKVFEDRQKKLHLSEEEKKDIIQMKTLIGENNLILQADGKLLVRHYAGFIQINKTRLLIYPKIASRASEEKEYDRAFEVLIKLLSYSGFTSIKKTPLAQAVGKYDGDLLELFIGVFAEETLFQLKLDINRGYNNQLENQSFIKGKIDFTQTFKKNSFRKHLHYVRYGQFSENILLNQILKSVASNLISRTQTKTNKIKLKQVLLWLEDVELVKLSNDMWGRVQFTRQNFKYEPVFNLAKLFYYNSSPSLNTGDEYTFSFLVPVNKLFEKYLYELIKNNISDELEVGYQGPVKYLATNKKYMQLKPDITLYSESGTQCIIDAKYKEVINEEGKLRLIQADVYQMLAYSVRYECNNIFLIYPEFINEQGKNMIVEEFSITNYKNTVVIKVIKVDLELKPDELATRLVEVLIRGLDTKKLLAGGVRR